MSGELANLRAPKGANRREKRVGRGVASGHGKTAGRGGKGQKARKSGHVRVGFEGGQMPLQRRLPKTGFVNPFTKRFAEVSLAQVDMLAEGGVVDEAALRKAGVVKGRWDGVKVLANGELTKRVSVRVNRISKSARETIIALGGTVELIADRVKWRRSDSRAIRRAGKAKQA